MLEHLPTFLVSCALWLPVGSQTLATRYQDAESSRVDVTMSFRMETTDMTRNGEPVDVRAGAGDANRQMSYIDTVVKVTEGRPVQVRRSFDEVGGTTSTEFGDNASSQDHDSPFEDAVLEITVDEDGDIGVIALEGDPGDDLDGHVPQLFLDAFLPTDEVEEGATWDLDNDAIRRGLGLDLENALYPPVQAEQTEGRGGRRGFGGRRNSTGRWMQQVEWEGEANLVSMDEKHEGMTCARIEIEMKCEANLEDLPEATRGGGGGGRGRGEIAITGTVAAELEGVLLFDLETKRPVRFTVDGSLGMDRTIERSGERTMTMTMTQEGTLSYTVEVGPAEEIEVIEEIQEDN